MLLFLLLLRAKCDNHKGVLFLTDPDSENNSAKPWPVLKLDESTKEFCFVASDAK